MVKNVDFAARMLVRNLSSATLKLWDLEQVAPKAITDLFSITRHSFIFSKVLHGKT